MTLDNELITISKPLLIAALLELDRAYSRDYFYLFHCLEQVEQAYLDLYTLVETCEFPRAQSELISLLCPNQQDFTISDTLLQEWEETFQEQLRLEKEQAKQKRPIIIIHR